MTKFDFMKQFLMFATLAVASGGSTLFRWMISRRVTLQWANKRE
jgi:hypothetical protein